jgi:ABC-type multidrug transport system fused ATPase/permease subunit
LPGRFRRKVWVACLILTIQSLSELLSLASIIPAVAALALPETFFRGGIGARIATMSGVASPQILSLMILAGVIGLFAVKNLFALFGTRYQARLVFDLLVDLSTRAYRHHLQSGFLAVRSRPFSEVAAEISGATQRFASNVILASLFLLTEAVVLVVLAAGVLWYEPVAFLAVAATILPPFGYFHLQTKRGIQQLESGIHRLEADLSGAVHESLSGYVELLSTGSEEFFLRRFSGRIGEFASLMSRRTLLGAIPSRLAEISLVLGVGVLCAYAMFRIPELPQRVTLFGVYLVAAYRFLPSANRITLCLLSIRGNAFSLDVVRKFTDAEDRKEPCPTEVVSFQEGVAFENVGFRYPSADEMVLENVSFAVRKGECVGITGPSGAGKSTLLNLLLGFLDPTTGSIRIDGTPRSVGNIKSWRRRVGYVQQEVFTLQGTIRENVAFGVEPDRTDAAGVERAVELAALSDFVRSLPEGLETPLGERGANLSMGQRQRIGIARALYHGAELLVFDEPTSALDPVAEREIALAIRRLHGQGFTLVIVSHRRELLGTCDRILQVSDKTLYKVSGHDPLPAPGL